MNTIRKVLTGILMGCMFMGLAAFADGQAAVLEAYTNDTDISVYVRGVPEGSEVNVQIATAEADSVQVQPVAELDIPMQTTVMIDNSISIPEADRGKIAEFLQDLIADRMEREEIRIASFSEDVNMLTDYTSDYSTLKKAVDGITYQNQETYLTDVLYDLLTAEYIGSTQDVYRRIIVISDGVDNKSLGYTKDELYALLKENPLPIYTVGSVNGKNNEELENMFALSRMTSVEYFLLDEVEDLLALTETLKQHRGLCKLTIVPPAEMMDGSRKNVRITLPDSTALSLETAMPQQVYAVEDTQEEEPEDPPVIEEVPVEIEETPVPEEAAPSGTESGTFRDHSGCSRYGHSSNCAYSAYTYEKEGQKAQENPADFSIPNIPVPPYEEPSEKTELITDPMGNPDDNSTVMIWEQSGVFEMTLTDVASPAKSFQAPLDHPVVVGRKKGVCDIALDYEKSVSGRHCEIRAEGGRFYVKDLQSSNGTCLNGNKVWAESEIFSGDVLKLGRLELRFEVR